MRSLRLYNASLEMNGVVNLSLRLREHSLVSLMFMEKLEVNDGRENKNENVDEDVEAHYSEIYRGGCCLLRANYILIVLSYYDKQNISLYIEEDVAMCLLRANCHQLLNVNASWVPTSLS